MPIRACPECSSDRLAFPKAGAATTFTCNDCSWAGTPREFPNWSSWQEFRVAARSRPAPAVSVELTEARPKAGATGAGASGSAAGDTASATSATATPRLVA